MRLWSIHPEYLDSKGIVALWRESLLAKNVIEGKTKGYINHPQLIRFKNSDNPEIFINKYLELVYNESVARNYNFDAKKFTKYSVSEELTVTSGQLKYEFQHLLNKLKIRDYEKWMKLENTKLIKQHPLFVVIDGGVEDWEIIG